MLSALEPLRANERTRARQSQIVLACGVTACVAHGLDLVIYAVAGIWLLAGLNLVSALVWAGFLLLFRRGFIAIALIVAFCEVSLHCAGYSWLLGREAGYALYYPTAMLSAFLVARPDQRLLRASWFIAFAISGVFVYYKAPATPYLPDIDEAFLKMLFDVHLFLGFGATALITAYFAVTSSRAEAIADRERQRSDALLTNVLPEEVAQELRQTGQATPRRHERTTIMFADLVGFTSLSERLGAAKIVTLLDELFSAYDEIMTRHGIEKIKTIGDAYMAVAGLPQEDPHHAREAVLAAREMLIATRTFAQSHGEPLDLRIGLNSGPLTGAVVGRRRFLFDVWGDAVNVAARMESHGVKGRVQLSESTWRLVQNDFDFELREALEIKGKGAMNAYLLIE